MRYDEALAWLYARQTRGTRLGLDRVRRLLAAIDDPQESFAALHVAGTVGKGSIATMLAACLREEGYRTGLYVSPHVSSFPERIVMDGKQIATDKVAQGIEELRGPVEAMEAEGDALTFFEITTALAFQAFRGQGVEVAAVEVGLGGRLDATNVVTPVACAIGPVGLDHQDRLGATIGAIAREKAGIIKPGVPCVTAASGQALVAIQGGAQEAGAPLHPVAAGSMRLTSETLDETRFETDAWGRRRAYGLALLGRHQALNALVAIRCLEAAGRYRVLPETVDKALAAVRMPGRLERLQARPDVLMDGAHNPPGAAALGGFLARAGGRQPLTLVFNTLADKDLEGIFGFLAGAVGRVLVPPVANVRGRDPGQTVSRLRAVGADAHEAGSVAEALADQDSDAVTTLVAGSLFLVGEARRRLLGLPEDPVGKEVLQ